MTDQLVTFALGRREYATALAAVREVVRLASLTGLPGMTPPLAGLLELRGASVPVLDLRVAATATDRGDVLVLDPGRRPDGGVLGVAVDRVRAVVPRSELPPDAPGAEDGLLPGYVLAVLRGSAGPVFLVDLEQMAGAGPARP